MTSESLTIIGGCARILPEFAEKCSGETLHHNQLVSSEDTQVQSNRTDCALDEGTSPREEFLYYSKGGQIEGIRQGDWKLLTVAPQGEGKPNTMLFNLAEDVSEKQNLAAEKPDLVKRLLMRMAELDAAILAGARPVWKKS